MEILVIAGTVLVVILGLFVCAIPMARLNDPAPQPVAVPITSDVEPNGSYRLHFRQKVVYKTRAGRLLKARVVGSNGNGICYLQRPRHRQVFHRFREEVIL